MSYRNPVRDRAQLVASFRAILPSAQQLPLFDVLNELGSRLDALYRSRTYSTTDCCTTADSLRSLFQPTNVETTRDLDALTEVICGSDWTYLQFELDNPYHMFVVVREVHEWWLLQSYHGRYELTARKIDIRDLLAVLSTGEAHSYNRLFGTQGRRLEGAITFTVDYGHVTGDPRVRLLRLLADFVDSADT
jgi:hypothetical protein